ncbi:cobyrinate a,c-diamide synthase [Deltaproteobacteria bacterium OttesenSCG-928-K17]|nr:cobyrinate a,c-diamide synthase [Deltaproteobacteria bacterium OttesenSCG-928-K17]
MKQARLVLAGAHSGVGKTSVSSGIMKAFRGRGLNVRPFKVGPDYIDPAFHEFVCGQKSRNLDSWMLNEESIRRLFTKNAAEAPGGLSIIEGVMGLFDGHSESGRGSTAHVASIIKAPIVLIVNGASIARSIAALVHGFNTFQPETKLAGVIINMVSGQAHYDLLRGYVEKEAGLPCFGYLKKQPEMVLESRHLGLVPSVEVADLETKLNTLAEAVEESIDLNGLLKLAASAPDLPINTVAEISGQKPVKIGLALDSAFNFYYQDGLDLLREYGAELVPFSPLADTTLPPGLDGLYFGGGFPEIFAAELEKNASLRQEIKEKLEGGLPAYAECGGLMYLGRELVDFEGRAYQMTGFFDHGASMTKRLQNFGYVTLTFKKDTVLGPAGTVVRAHEFHHSRLDGDGFDYALAIKKNENRAWEGGLVKKNVLAAYPHLHFHANIELARNFVNKCRA